MPVCFTAVGLLAPGFDDAPPEAAGVGDEVDRPEGVDGEWADTDGVDADGLDAETDSLNSSKPGRPSMGSSFSPGFPIFILNFLLGWAVSP